MAGKGVFCMYDFGSMLADQQEKTARNTGSSAENLSAISNQVKQARAELADYKQQQAIQHAEDEKRQAIQRKRETARFWIVSAITIAIAAATLVVTVLAYIEG
jgi:Flp pilus assembly protein TadB